MPRRHSVRLSFAFCSLIAAPLLAQDAPPAESGTTIHATVDEVALDLVVRDKKGRLVKNLKPGDVEIYEDGVRQEIRSLRLVGGGEAPALAMPQPDRQAVEAQSEPPNAAQTAPLPLRSVNLVCIVFHQLDSVTRKWAVAAAQDFINTQLRP